MILIDVLKLEGHELDFISNYGWQQYNIKFNNALINELNNLYEIEPEFLKYFIKKINGEDRES